ncbi:hypothetical protein ACFOZ0_02090 [Streptomyces yaanensis]|uniref:Uncharacterized protein n=1 Tax=Streptomyces yaanensis TaxID=1142239 RepID=A0ABV7S9H7_9ACTN|nr:hypothetical protein [Streptomyces sp. CGMCC 4.7035]WNB99679.1 hypothetical protein Q2K21_17305 [Streptomyces sp. CGMCC 4.7035]
MASRRHSAARAWEFREGVARAWRVVATWAKAALADDAAEGLVDGGERPGGDSSRPVTIAYIAESAGVVAS